MEDNRWQEGAWVAWAGGAAALLIACGVTWAALQAMRRWRLLDQPNERSAHRVPMPTGGGLGIMAGFWGGMLVLGASGGEWPKAVRPALLGSTLVLLVAVVDDLVRPLRVGEKFLLLLAATGVWLGWGPRLEGAALPGLGIVELGAWGWPLSALWFIWLCNVVNFMDGIDGLSASQTACAAGWAALCLWPLEQAAALVGLVLGAAALGFLVFNFPPGRIFMGDVGSLFAGFALAGLGIMGQAAGLPLWVFAVFIGFQLFDTSYTLARRALRGENVLRAHNKHLYQRLTRLGWSHRQVDVWAMAISMLLGAGGYGYLFVSARWGAALMGLGGALLVGMTAWIERREKSFV
jgi:UDP-N-acetylmuramyl pentapeptide phosphotransferase/UDP-N-acetylglucosamine-1-phosphate transferase